MVLTFAVYHNSRMCCRHDGERGVDWSRPGGTRGGSGEALVDRRCLCALGRLYWAAPPRVNRPARRLYCQAKITPPIRPSKNAQISPMTLPAAVIE